MNHSRFGAALRWGVCLAAAASVSAGQEARAALANQPANKHSTLVDKDGKNIRDDELAGWIKTLLLPSDVNDVRDAKFLFQECFGGGMLDDLVTALGTKVKWVGGAASRHDEAAVGQVSTAENAIEGWAAKWVGDPPENGWTRELKGEMVKDQTLVKGIDNAAANDTTNTTAGKTIEHGQSVHQNGGDTIKLKDAGATSHHAVLWGGDADHMRHFNNVKNIRAALINQWGALGANVTITTLFGNGTKASDGSNLPAAWGAQAATKANLQNVLTGLAGTINTNEQFFFYASDHGSTVTVAAENKSVPADSVVPVNFSLSAGELDGMFLQFDNQPVLVVELSSVPSSTVSVTLNQTAVGTLSNTSATTTLLLDEADLDCTNVLEFTTTASSVDINLATVELGSIDTNPRVQQDPNDPNSPPSGFVCAASPVPAASNPHLLVLAMALVVGAGLVFAYRARPS